jgi:hypothetical protein
MIRQTTANHTADHDTIFVKVTGATGTYNVPILSYYHSFSLLGRSANISAALPYGVGTFRGEVLGTEQQIYRSGLLDSGYRLSVNLKGGPAMPAQEFVKWKQKFLLGASFRVIAPTGQYDPTKIINWGINRWAFKPEVGCSRRWGNWVLDGYAGVWFYTRNNAFYSVPAPVPQTERPIGALEGHLSHDFGQLKFWASLDGNFWFGGIASLSGIENPATKQTGSRIGVTGSFPIGNQQSIKINYSDGAYVLYGGDYHNVSVAWQYSWLGKP